MFLLHLHHFRDISATRGNRCLPSCVRVYFNKWLLSKRWCQLFRPSVSHSPVAIKERLWDWNGSTALRFVPFVCHLVFLKDLRVCKEKARRDVFLSRENLHDFHLLWTDSWNRSSWGIHWPFFNRSLFKWIFICELKLRLGWSNLHFSFSISALRCCLFGETDQTEHTTVQLGT